MLHEAATSALKPNEILARHQETFLSLKEVTDVDRRFAMPYRKTYEFAGDFINRQHAELVSNLQPNGMIDLGIEGWLLPADALKLYELAYFCGGDILELGTYQGLSTSILAQASHDRGPHNAIVTIDLSGELIEIARRNLEGRPGADRVHYFATDGEEAMHTFVKAERSFEFVFVDHSHAYEHVYPVCSLLDKVVKPGCFCLFHDFNDPRNGDPAHIDYGVHQAVLDGLDPCSFEFWGIYGCVGLFRRAPH